MPDIPKQVQFNLDEADKHLTAGEDELIGSLADVHTAAHQSLNSAEDELHSALDGAIGHADNLLTQSHDQLMKALSAAFNAADTSLSTGEGLLRDQGWSYPYSPGDVQSVIDTGVSNVLPYMVPELGHLVDQSGAVVPPCDVKNDPTCAGTIPPEQQPTIPPPVMPPPPQVPPSPPQPPLSPPPSGPCVGPGGLIWADSPEGQQIIAQNEAAGTPLYPTPRYVDGILCQVWVQLMLGVDPGTEPAILIGPCIGSDGSPYSYQDVCNGQPQPQVPPYVPPPYVPPAVPPPQAPPTPPQAPCPPQQPCCPDPVVNVTVNVPPIVLPPWSQPPQPVPPEIPGVPPTQLPPLTPPASPPPPAAPPPTPLPVQPPTFILRPPPDVDESVYLFDWRYTDVCEVIEQEFTNVVTPVIKPITPPTGTTEQEPLLLQWWANAVSGVASEITESIVDAVPSSIAAGVDSFIASGFKLLNTFFSLYPVTGSNHVDRLIKLGTSLSVSAWAERLTGAPIRYLNQDTLYAYQYESPQYIPTPGDVHDLYRRNLITSDTFTCLIRAHGLIPTWQQTIAYASQSRPPAGELHRLYDRGIIDNDEWTRRMVLHGWKDESDRNLSYTVTEQYLDIRTAFDAYYREVINSEQLQRIVQGTGWRSKEQIDAFAQTMQFLPPYSDVIRMMVHDVEDSSVVSDYQLDTSFADKFTGTLAKWAQWQRIPYNAALYMWRSHWQYPSPTQTYQFLRRLRPDRPERVAWEKENPRLADESEYQYHNRGPLAFTVDEAKRLLSVNDMAPTFIGPEIAVSYNPITRTDAIRAYEVGFFDDAQLKWNFIYNGYIDADADLLVGFEREQKARRVANATGVLTIRKIIKYYQGGAITRGDANTALIPLMVNPADRQTVLDRAEEEMIASSRQLRINALKRQVLTGGMSSNDAINAMIDAGVDRFTAVTLADQWDALIKSRLKEPTAAMLCKWRNHQFITDADYFIRLQRLGYSYEDASRILSVCVKDLLDKQKKAADAAKEKARKELEKSLKNQYQLEQASQKQLQKWIDTMTKNLAAAQKQLDKVIHQAQSSSPPPPPAPGG